jgi:hypothetical protein
MDGRWMQRRHLPTPLKSLRSVLVAPADCSTSSWEHHLPFAAPPDNVAPATTTCSSTAAGVCSFGVKHFIASSSLLPLTPPPAAAAADVASSSSCYAHFGDEASEAGERPWTGRSKRGRYGGDAGDLEWRRRGPGAAASSDPSRSWPPGVLQGGVVLVRSEVGEGAAPWRTHRRQASPVEGRVKAQVSGGWLP